MGKGFFLLFILYSCLIFSVSAKACESHIARAGTLRVALVQYPMQRGLTLNQRKAKFEKYIREAAEAGAEVVVYPELIGIEGLTELDPQGADPAGSIRALARQETPLLMGSFKQWAKQYALTIVAGSWPELTASGEVLNTSFVINPKGELIHKQPKNHSTHWEAHDYLMTGSDTKALSLKLPGNIDAAIAICFDSEFPNYLDVENPVIPEIIFVPSMTSDDFGRFRVARSASSRAVEHHAYVLVTGTVGGDVNDPVLGAHEGQAKVFTPSDVGFPANGILAEGVINQDQVLIVDLDLLKLRESRKTSTTFPVKVLHGK